MTTLSRPRQGRMLGGVCAGIARRYGWSPTTVRLATVVIALLPGPMILAYIVACFVIPSD